MTFPFPPGPDQPIPNPPFYAPETNYLKGEYGPFIVGSGFYINNLTGTIETTGTGGIAVTSLTASAGLQVNRSTGAVTITNTGVVALTAGNGISISNVGGNYTITNTLPASGPAGTVTSITAGTGLTGGTITTSGTIALSPSGVGPATYTNPTITVDQYGRVTFATNGLAGGGGILATAPLQATSGVYPQTISISPASTLAPGAVQLNDTVTSTSTTQAATARALKQTYDLASSSGSSATLALSTANTANTTANTACSIAVVACNCALTALNAATSAQIDATQALINAAAAQTTANTALTNANTALTNSATAQTTANSAFAAANNAIPKIAFVSKGQLLVGTSLGAYLALNPGTNGKTLIACSSCASGLAWSSSTSSPGNIPPSSPTVGSFWYNTSVSPAELQIWNGTSWVSATGGAGTVTSIATGIGLTGGPITTTGTISLANTSVSPGSYTLGSFTVDSKGRLTSASSGSINTTAPIVNIGTSATPNIGILTATTGQQGVVRVGTNVQVASGVISVRDASILDSGVVQLNNTLTSTSTTQALTAAQGKALQDQINGLSVTSNLTLAGTFDAAGSQMLTVTADGTAAGFTLAANLPAASAGNESYFVIVTTAGSYNPPGGGGPYNANQGDWFLSNGTVWEFLNVGTDLPVASTGSSGIVQLATVADTQTGTSTTLAVTPAGAAATYIPCASLTAKGAILTATGASVPTALPVGTNGQYLIACSACSSGLTWGSLNAVTSITAGTGLAGGTITSSGTLSLANTTVTPGTYNYATITVDAQGRLTAASTGTPPTGGTVSSITAGTGLTGGTITTTGTINLANTAVTPGPYTYGSFTVDAQGRLTAASSGTAPVTSITAGTGLTGGTITSTGTINLANTAVTPGPYTYGSFTVDAQGRITAASSGTAPNTTVTAPITNSGTAIAPVIGLANTAVSPGSYTNASITVDAQGRLTAASSGTAPVTAVTGTAPIAVTAGVTPVVSIAASSTTAVGAVQLYNDVNSTSTTLALTAAQGKVLQDQITLLSNAGGVNLAGTIDASTGFVASVTSIGTSAGYTVGSVLPAASATTNNTYVIVTNPGTMTPPGGSATTATRGDWFLASETSPGVYAWGFLNVGFDAPAATTSIAGIVCLSTNALAQAGTDTTTALTPAAAASAYVPKACITAKGALITGTAASTPTALTAGTDGQILVACSTATTGLCWLTSPYVPCSAYTAKGTILGASAASTPAALAVGTDGQALIACAACTSGLTWGNLTVSAATPTAAGIILGCTVASNTSLGCNASAASAGSILNNVAIGTNALAANTAMQFSIAIGSGAMCAGSSGGNNVGIGASALRNANGANCNVAVGNFASCSLSFACCTVAIGHLALSGAANAHENTAIGVCALRSTANGVRNVALGNLSLTLLAGPSNDNVSLGYKAGCGVTSGNSNVLIGACVNPSSLTGSCQLAIGFDTNRWLSGDSTFAIKPGAGIIDCAGSCGTAGQALLSNGANAVCWGNVSAAAATPTTLGTVHGRTCNTGPSANSSFGWSALANATASTSNTAVGTASLGNLTTGINNVAVGNQALLALGTNQGNVAIGAYAGCCDTAFGNVWIGAFAGRCVGFTPSTGNQSGANVAVGFAAGMRLGCTGCAEENTLVGWSAGQALDLGRCNTFIGSRAGSQQTAGWHNILIGAGIQAPNLASDCQLVIGVAGAVTWIYGCNNGAVRFGRGIVDCAGTTGANGQALLSTGLNNYCWGPIPGALCGFTCTVNTNANTALGFSAGTAITTGICNTFVGYQAGCNATAGNCNVLIGNGNTTALIGASTNNNVLIGPRLAQFGLSGTSSNNLAISSCGGVLYSLAAASNIIQVGNLQHSAAYVSTSWTPVSDIRDKTEIKDVALGLDFVKELAPIRFKRCDRETGELNSNREYYGFSAQEVLETEEKYGDSNVIVDNTDLDRLRLTTDHIVPVLVNAIKELSAKVEELEAKLAANG